MLIRFFLPWMLLFSTLVLLQEITVRGSGKIGISDGKETSDKHIRLLFLGNSLTYTNDLPALVEQRALEQGFKVRADMIALPNYAIIDHWMDGKASKRILKGQYDFVIVQQGPSSQAEGLRLLKEGGSKFSELCKKKGARLCYYMVWPAREHYASFDAVIRNHEEAARSNEALLCPVGKVWKGYIDTTGRYDYYGPDGFHPSLKGSQVAAAVIVNSLFGAKPDTIR